MTADNPIPGPVGRFAEHGPARSESEPVQHWSELGSAEELAECIDQVADQLARKLGWYEESAQIGQAANALRELGEPRPMMLDTRLQREHRGMPALARLIKIGQGDSGQTRHVRRFLIGLYNGPVFPFDLTDLRCVDRAIQEDMLAVLAMDIDGPSVEIHCRDGAEVIATWAADAWPKEV